MTKILNEVPEGAETRDAQPTDAGTDDATRGRTVQDDQRMQELANNLPVSKRTVRVSSNLPRRVSLPIQIVLTILVIVGWEYFSRSFHWERSVSRPSEVVDQLREWWSTGELQSGLRATLAAAGLGAVIGAGVGTVTGMLLGWFRFIGNILEPFVVALYTLPKVALAPLFVLWFGINLQPKVVLTAVLVFFVVFLTTQQAAAAVDRESVEMVYLMGGKSLAVLQKVVVPHALIGMFSGFKIALPYVLIGPVIGEFMASSEGIGFLIKNATDTLNTAGVFAGLTLLMVMALILSAILRAVEHYVLSWREDQG